MRSRLLIAVLALALLNCLASCGRNPYPSDLASPQPAISVTELSQNGFGGGATVPGIMAAPSLIDLSGLLHAVGASPSLGECNQVPQVRKQCWLDIKDQGDSLMVAAELAAPCMSVGPVNAVLTGTNELTITVANSGSCGRGSSEATPNLSLLAIPLIALPADEITVKLAHSGASVPTAKMMVDLRRPLDTRVDVQTRMNEATAAINAAMHDAVNRVTSPIQTSFLTLGTNRWTDNGLGCPTPGKSYLSADARGYVVFLQESDQPQLALEYHVSGPILVFCGQVAY